MILALAAAAFGCNAGDPIPGASAPPVGGGGTTDGGTTPGQGADGSAQEPSQVCSTLTRGGDVVWELSQAGDAPVARGGTLVPGTYHLVELYVYGGATVRDGGVEDDSGRPGGGGEPPVPDPVTGRTLQSTIVVTGDTLRFAEQWGKTGSEGGTPSTEVGFFTIDGTSVEWRSVCPTVGTRTKRSFTAGNDGFMLFRDATHTEIYAKRD